MGPSHGGGAMEFRILGPLEVFEGEAQLPLGKPRERAVLAAFLLHANEPLSRERVIDLVWGESPPRTADAAFYNCVSKLRRALGADRLPGDGGAYRLVVGEGELDAGRFEALLTRGQTAFDQGAPDSAAVLLREALALWRGAPLDDVRYESFAQNEIGRLGELRVTALEARIEADLERGHPEQLIAELEGLVLAHPWRERFHAQLMVALYRCGRQSDALEAYQAARSALSDELGLEPGAELDELERKILRHDPTLELAESAAPTSVPLPATRLIGREQELAELNGILGADDLRLLTLVGPGGVGKTRLALELAATSARQVVFADLSPLSAAEQVLPVIAHALGVRETGGQSLVDATIARARGLDECLLVVDNFERVVDAAPELAAIVASCPKLRTLVTSREPLHVGAERAYPLEPLSEKSAESLFVERCSHVQPSFASDASTAALCRRLDCLPLALELAAARTNVLTAQQILERLGRRDDLLTAGARDAPARQQTLRAAIQWSYELLDESEKLLFSGLSVFAGGCTLEAAEAVCGAGLDTLASLVDKSLVRRRGDRFAMLETIREYATEMLEESERADDRRRRHMEYFLALVEREDPRTFMFTPQVAAVVAADYDNLHAGVAWAVKAAPELALRLAAMLCPVWLSRSMFAEGRHRLEQALQNTPDEPSRARATALAAASYLAGHAGDIESSRRLGEAALSAARVIDEPLIVVFALHTLSGAVMSADDDYEAALRLGEEAAELCRRSGDEFGLAVSIGNLGGIAHCRGEWDKAIAFYTEQLSMPVIVWPNTGITQENLALAELQNGREPAAVAARYEETFRRASESGGGHVTTVALHGLGLTAARAGHDLAAVRVLACALADCERLGYALDLPEQAVHQETLAQLRDHLGEDVFAAAWAEGRLLSLNDAFALAVESIRSGARAANIASSHL
jgi:predicted ATPase/DNA-binding SARP family transcriptional activator